jgi:hypothetical protein
MLSIKEFANSGADRMQGSGARPNKSKYVSDKYFLKKMKQALECTCFKPNQTLYNT